MTGQNLDGFVDAVDGYCLLAPMPGEGEIGFELSMDVSTGSPGPRAAVVRQHDQRDDELDHSANPCKTTYQAGPAGASWPRS